MIDLSKPLLQREFAELVGITQQAVCAHLKAGRLTEDAPASTWLVEYCHHLREEAAGRASGGEINLAEERAHLARAQRRGQELRNEITAGTFARIELLNDCLSDLTQGIADRLDQLPSAISKICPDLPRPLCELILSEVARVRNEALKTVSVLDALTVETEDDF